MPTYEYECTKCGEQFEYFQSIKDAPREECESCGGKLTKLLSAGTGLIFKGSGFYITDYKAKSGETSTSDSKGGESKSKDAGGENKTNCDKPAGSGDKSSKPATLAAPAASKSAVKDAK